MKTSQTGQHKSLPPTPHSETKTGVHHSENVQGIQEGKHESFHRVQSWETTPNDEEKDDRAKDDDRGEMRFAELETALEIAREEQQKMSQELHKLRSEGKCDKQESRQLQEDLAKLRLDHEQDLHSLQNKLEEESKTSEHWSRKHHTALADLHDLKERWLERDEMWKHEWERKAADVLEERDQLREKVHTAQKIAHVRGEESEETRRQLLDLKQNISTSTRMQNQVTDHEFADMMSGLNHEIQNWIVHNFRKSKNAFSNISSSLRDNLEQAVPLYKAIFSSSRLILYQAFMIDRLMEIFEEPLCFGLPEDGPLSHIRGLANYLQPSSPDFNQWRSLTLSIIERDEQGHLAKHTEGLLDSIQADAGSALGEMIATELTSSQMTSLRVILENAVKAARLIRRQRASFVFELPRVSAERKALFDGNVMEDVSGEDEEELRGRKVQCATFPAVYKLGDERGENMHLRNVIFKARVLCTPSSK